MKRFMAVVMLFFAVGMIIGLRYLTQARQGNQAVYASVVYADGTPAANATVLRYRSDRESGLQSGIQTGADGSFVVRDLEPGVSYTLCASKREEGYPDPFFLPFGLPVGGRCEKVVLRGGGQPLKVQLQLSKKAGSVAGTVLDARSRMPIIGGKATIYRPLKFEGGAWVLTGPNDARWTPSQEGLTDAAGKFIVSNLPEGQYSLKVEADGYRSWFFPAQANEAAAQALLIKSGTTRKIAASLKPSHQ
jgi:hypothetical protein